MSKAPPFERKDGSTLTVQREGKLGEEGEGGREGRERKGDEKLSGGSLAVRSRPQSI